MTPAIRTVLGILAIAGVLMVTEALRADVVAWLVAMALALTGVIGPDDAFSGFARSAVITVLAVFILSQGLQRTGVARRVGRALQGLAGDRPGLLLLLTMLAGAGFSLVMNNIAAAAVLLPATTEAARRAGVSPSKLLLPLAFGTILGGTATLLSTSNIVVSSVLADRGLAPFGLLEFAPVGLPLVAVGVLYMLLVGRRILVASSPSDEVDRIQRLRQELTEVYALEERLAEVRVSFRSALAGQSIAASRIGERLGLSVLAVHGEGGRVTMAPPPEQVLRPGDTLLVAGKPDRVRKLAGLGAEVLDAPSWNDDLSDGQVALLEVVVAPRSHAAGRTLKELHFREKYGLSVVALWRGGRSYRTDVGDIRLQFGDALLIHGARTRVAVLQGDPDFLVLGGPGIPLRTQKGWVAVLITVLTLAAAASGLLPVAVAMMVGALCMVLTGCLAMDEAYRSVEWRAVFLLAGMLPVGIALDRSGASDWLGQVLVQTLAGAQPLVLVAVLFLLGTALTQVVSGQVAAVILAPVAVAAARQTGAEPRSVAMATAIGCSMAFLTPTAHPVNVLVMALGGYRMRDFLRVGLPLTLLLFLTLLLVLPAVRMV